MFWGGEGVQAGGWGFHDGGCPGAGKRGGGAGMMVYISERIWLFGFFKSQLTNMNISYLVLLAVLGLGCGAPVYRSTTPSGASNTTLYEYMYNENLHVVQRVKYEDLFLVNNALVD